MRASSLKWVVGAIIILLIIFAGIFVALKNVSKEIPVVIPVQAPIVTQEVVGKSVQGRNIEAFSYGAGSTTLAFIGGIHGGYEWNSVLLAYKFMDYLTANPTVIPKNLKIIVIPSANPDGVYQVVGKGGQFTVADVKDNLPVGTGRFNVNKVDLNRNFACNWQATSTWRNNIVSAGTAVFSEPEAQAIKNFVSKNNPTLVIFWHSQSNAIYASACNNGILAETSKLMKAYSLASGYRTEETFDSYAITGDASDWLASQGVPSFTVELQTHESIEWEKNLAGIKALFEYYRNK